MKTVAKGQKSDTSKEELAAIADYCATHPVFEESNRKAAQAISSLEDLPLPKELRKLVEK